MCAASFRIAADIERGWSLTVDTDASGKRRHSWWWPPSQGGQHSTISTTFRLANPIR